MRRSALTTVAAATAAAALAWPGPAGAFGLEEACANDEGVLRAWEDVDSFRHDGGSNNVDLGDSHVGGAPRGDAALCWLDPRGGEPTQVRFIGRLYWDAGFERRTGCSDLFVTFSTDGSTWVSRQRIGVACSTGFPFFANKLVRTLITHRPDEDQIRLQLYRRPTGGGGRRVKTVLRARGD